MKKRRGVAVGEKTISLGKMSPGGYAVPHLP